MSGGRQATDEVLAETMTECRIEVIALANLVVWRPSQLREGRHARRD
jgi:hypothetical protein